MNNLYIFDVDGVLCNRGENIDTEFKSYFTDWIKGKKFSLLTGSNREKTIHQIGQDLVNQCEISYHCMGNNIWIDNREICINQFVLKKEEYDFLQNYINNHSFPVKTGNHIDIRKGSVNFSIVGRNATTEERKLYISFDKMFGDRLKFIKNFCKKFPRFDAYLGGDISIDICLKGCDKSQILEFCLPFDCLYFFGDRCYPYGIDYPLSRHLTERTLELLQHRAKIYPMNYFQINHGYQQTWEILKHL